MDCCVWARKASQCLPCSHALAALGHSLPQLTMRGGRCRQHWRVLGALTQDGFMLTSSGLWTEVQWAATSTHTDWGIWQDTLAPNAFREAILQEHEHARSSFSYAVGWCSAVRVVQRPRVVQRQHEMSFSHTWWPEAHSTPPPPSHPCRYFAVCASAQELRQDSHCPGDYALRVSHACILALHPHATMLRAAAACDGPSM